ncbi:MAG: GNAT family N-acetyltransferase [Erysipelotrichaceae bacterium]
MVITSERLMLRNFCKNDLSDLHDFCRQEKVMSKLGMPTHHFFHQSDALLKEWITDNSRFAIVLNDKVIGYIAIYPYDEDDDSSVELAFGISEEYQNKGYMFETISVIIEFVFSLKHIKRIYADVMVGNYNCEKLLIKLGFHFGDQFNYFLPLMNKEYLLNEYYIEK